MSGISEGEVAENAWIAVRAARFPENPIVSPRTRGWADPDDSGNINGPSLIRVPEWLRKPLGKYYLYFAHHGGKHIRLACADDLHGPWTIHTPGVLGLERTGCIAHIASPDVHVDPRERRLRMYFHGPVQGKGQLSFAALSEDGLSFSPRPEVLAPFYLRMFRRDGRYYGIAKHINESAVLVRSQDGLTNFEQGPKVLPRCRHVALRLDGDTLWIFFSRIGDAPEHILLTRFDLRGDWTEWERTAPPPVSVLMPEKDYEGIGFPLEASKGGRAVSVRQLRDPGLFEEAGKLYLIYSVAGEMGLAMAELSFEPASAGPRLAAQ